jgi:hypothetical protein
VGKTREESHALMMALTAEDEARVVDVPARRGDVVVHHERAVHAVGFWGAGGLAECRVRACGARDAGDGAA